MLLRLDNTHRNRIGTVSNTESNGRRKTYNADVRVKLVDSAKGVEDPVCFSHAVAGEKRGLPLVASFRVNLHTSRIKMEYSNNTPVI